MPGWNPERWTIPSGPGVDPVSWLQTGTIAPHPHPAASCTTTQASLHSCSTAEDASGGASRSHGLSRRTGGPAVLRLVPGRQADRTRMGRGGEGPVGRRRHSRHSHTHTDRHTRDRGGPGPGQFSRHQPWWSRWKAVELSSWPSDQDRENESRRTRFESSGELFRNRQNLL